MNALVPLVMYSWIPVVLFLFKKFKPRDAVVIAFIGAWLFLPMASFKFKGIPDYTKVTATCEGILLAAAIFDKDRLAAYTFHPVDFPMLFWCICPFFSSIANGLGPYDGLSETIYQTATWGMPYFIGRVYFTDLDALKLLAYGVFIGGLIYIPFCLYEIKMSPQLHRIVYGYHQHEFLQTIRYGGYRPMVFLSHGLMVGTWMMSAALIGVWAFFSKSLSEKIYFVPTGLLLLALLVANILVKSTGALVLLLIGLLALFIALKLKTKFLIWLLILIAPLYIVLRSSGMWTGENLTTNLARLSEDRAQSIQFRFDNEKILVDKALEMPVFGWGGWGRSRVYDEKGKDVSVTDGLWIIALGTKGIVGVTALTLAVLLPAMIFFMKIPSKDFILPHIGPAVALSMLLVLYMIDNLLNAMINPVYMLFAGGLGSLAQYGMISLKETAPEEILPAFQTRFIPSFAGERKTRFL